MELLTQHKKTWKRWQQGHMVVVQSILISDLGGGSVHRVVVLPFRGTSTSWRTGPKELYQVQQRKSAESCPWGRNSPMCSAGWGLVGCKIAWQKWPEGS